MAFASICGRDGIADVTLFEGATMQYAQLIELGELVAVRGSVTQDLERGIGLDVTQVHAPVGLSPLRICGT